MQGEGDGVVGFALEDGIELADGFIDVADIEEHAAIVGVRFEIVRINCDGLLVETAGVVVIEEGIVSAAEIEGRLAVSGVGGEGALEGGDGFPVVLLVAFEV